MSLVYWDTMLFVYWLEDTPGYSEQVASIYEAMLERGDVLCGSTFTLAELLVAPRKRGDQALERQITEFFESKAIHVIPFDVPAAKRFAEVRAAGKVSPADAIHLACAAKAGIDLFITNDSAMRKLNVPGINFIDGLQTSVLVK
jgi:predicted nucleic acid-binding protein